MSAKGAAEPAQPDAFYCEARHLRVSIAGRWRGCVGLGRERQTVVVVNHLSIAARLLHDSDVVGGLQRSSVSASCVEAGLAVWPPPFALPPRIEVALL